MKSQMHRTGSRSDFLPYCLPLISEEEIGEVAETIRSAWLTTGPKLHRFEHDFAGYVGVRHAIAVSSCTAALHIALTALGVQPGDEVIVPTLTFCATANVVVHMGQRGRERVVREFRHEVVEQALVAEYERLLRGKVGHHIQGHAESATESATTAKTHAPEQS